MEEKRPLYLSIAIATLFTCFIFTACKTTTSLSGTKEQWVKKSVREAAAPCSGPEFYSTQTTVSASSRGESKEQKKAKQLALKEVCYELETVIHEVVNTIVADDYNNNSKSFTGKTKQQFETMVKPIIKEQVAKYNLTCEKCVEKKGKYKCYVAVEIDANEIAQLLFQKLTDKQEPLRIDSYFEKFKEKFDVAVEKELQKQIAREGKTLTEYNKMMQRRLANKQVTGHYISLGSSILSSGYYGTAGISYEYRYNLFGFNAAVGYSLHDIWRETESIFVNAGVKLYFAKKAKVLRNIYINFLPLCYYGNYTVSAAYYLWGKDYEISFVSAETVTQIGAGIFLGYSPVWHVNKRVALGFNVGVGTKISYFKGYSCPINWDLGFVIKIKQ